MNAKAVLCVLVAVLVLVLQMGCSGSLAAVEASLGDEFSLAIGQSATIEGENLEVTFLKLLGDDRCPSGANCIQSGSVRCSVEFVSSGGSDEPVAERMVLSQPGLTEQPAVKTYQDYRVSCRVLPYPEAEQRIPDKDYRLLLTLTR